MCSLTRDWTLPSPHLPEFLVPLSCPQRVLGTPSAEREAAAGDARSDPWLGTDSRIVSSRVREQVLPAALRGSRSRDSAPSGLGGEQKKACLPPA